MIVRHHTEDGSVVRQLHGHCAVQALLLQLVQRFLPSDSKLLPSTGMKQVNTPYMRKQSDRN